MSDMNTKDKQDNSVVEIWCALRFTQFCCSHFWSNTYNLSFQVGWCVLSRFYRVPVCGMKNWDLLIF